MKLYVIGGELNGYYVGMSSCIYFGFWEIRISIM